VAALSPVTRNGEADRPEALAVVEFRNKRDEAIVFLPERLLLVPGDGAPRRPAEVKRAGRSAVGDQAVAPWSEAGFAARFELPEEALEAKSWTLRWSYRWAGREYPQATRFEKTDRRPGEWSGAGDAPGLTEGRCRESASGVPFLMDIPFLGALFGSRSRSVCSGGTEFGMAASEEASGSWWEMAP
jgi:hypothetical protein